MPSNLTCSFPGCLNGGRIKKGWCAAHYDQSRTGRPLVPVNTRQRKKGSPPRIICDEVACPVPGLTGPCHVFRGDVSSKGYGRVGAFGRKGHVLVHIYIWEKENGPIPDGLVVDHQCRVRACCNTDHLRIVTRAVNSTENVVGSAPQLQRAMTHCKRGHPFDEENTYWRLDGHRGCKECQRAHVRLWQRQRRLKLKGAV